MGGRGQAEGGHPHDHGERGAHVHAEDAGVGDGVAGHALHDRPGHAQGGAGQDREQGAGDAFGHGRLVEPLRRAAQRRHDGVPTDVARADGHGDAHQAEDHQGRRREPQDAQASWAPYGADPGGFGGTGVRRGHRSPSAASARSER